MIIKLRLYDICISSGAMNGNRKKLIGIEIGGTKLQIAASDINGKTEQLLHYIVDPEAGAAGIQTQIKKSILEIGTEKIAAIGVGFGGPLDWKTGIIQTSHQVEGWWFFNLKAWLQDLTQAPVLIDNDANVAALAEAIHGSGIGYNPVFYITIGSGIGGGLVVNHEIYHGATPGEVEIGHIRLDKAGATVESVCSGWAVNKKVRAYINAHPHSLLAQLAAKNAEPDAALLQPALEKEDAAAQKIVTDFADDLAFALSHVVHLFHPQIIIIGGGLSLLGEQLRRPVAERLPHYMMTAFLPPSVISIATLRATVVPVGALELAKKAYDATGVNNHL